MIKTIFAINKLHSKHTKSPENLHFVTLIQRNWFQIVNGEIMEDLGTVDEPLTKDYRRVKTNQKDTIKE